MDGIPGNKQKPAPGAAVDNHDGPDQPNFGQFSTMMGQVSSSPLVQHYSSPHGTEEDSISELELSPDQTAATSSGSSRPSRPDSSARDNRHRRCVRPSDPFSFASTPSSGGKSSLLSRSQKDTTDAFRAAAVAAPRNTLNGNPFRAPPSSPYAPYPHEGRDAGLPPSAPHSHRTSSSSSLQLTHQFKAMHTCGSSSSAPSSSSSSSPPTRLLVKLPLKNNSTPPSKKSSPHVDRADEFKDVPLPPSAAELGQVFESDAVEVTSRDVPVVAREDPFTKKSSGSRKSLNILQQHLLQGSGNIAGAGANTRACLEISAKIVALACENRHLLTSHVLRPVLRLPAFLSVSALEGMEEGYQALKEYVEKNSRNGRDMAMIGKMGAGCGSMEEAYKQIKQQGALLAAYSSQMMKAEEEKRALKKQLGEKGKGKSINGKSRGTPEDGNKLAQRDPFGFEEASTGGAGAGLDFAELRKALVKSCDDSVSMKRMTPLTGDQRDDSDADSADEEALSEEERAAQLTEQLMQAQVAIAQVLRFQAANEGKGKQNVRGKKKGRRRTSDSNVEEDDEDESESESDWTLL